MCSTNLQKNTTPITQLPTHIMSSKVKPEENEQPTCPPAPEPRKRKTVSVVPDLASRTAPSAAIIVTPILPMKRRRLDNIASPSPIPAASPTSRSTPSFQDLYGDDDQQDRSVQSILVPDLRQAPRPGSYKRRNSVTKFSILQSAHQMTIMEAARKTLEKLRQESLQKKEGHTVGRRDKRALRTTMFR